ncbi:hypothetical protein LCGC14_2164650 [marine sediment metagenome]|uniref:Uncharacterized protein n=1 Tax=marine sediment metagenome TaxID=412755 RepID=A0A0F9DRP8_9ZZZZ
MAAGFCSECTPMAGITYCTEITGFAVDKAACVWAAVIFGVGYDIRCVDGTWILTVSSLTHDYDQPCAQFSQANADGCPPLNNQWQWVRGCCDGRAATVTTS